MPRERKLQIVIKRRKIYARTTYVGLDGKRHALWRAGKNRTKAKENLQKALDELKSDEGAITHAKKTFADLAKWYSDRYLVEPVYREGRIIKGKRSWRSEKYLLQAIIEYFGTYRLRSISHGELEKYKEHRLTTKIRLKLRNGKYIQTNRLRTIASVNRELMHIRAMLRKAQKEGWLLRVPFEEHDPLIRMSDERRRERTLSYGEETRLLAACEGPRKHLRPIIVCAVATGMRLGEILKLEWPHVDFTRQEIGLISTNTKSLTYRSVPITTPLMVELERLKAEFVSIEGKPDLVFGVETNVKRSFKRACELAGIKHGGIDGLTFHCLRHTAGTRMVKRGMSLAEVGRILGHADIKTSYRYISADSDVMDKARAALAFRPPTSQND